MKTHVSKFKDYVKRDTVSNIIKFYDGMGYGAYRAGEIPQAHEYWQHSEHWRKISANKQ